ncbi:MAG: VWA domain-containing protein, partial [Coprococcus sp.]
KSKIDEDNLKKIAGDMDIKYINMNKQSNINQVLKDVKSAAKTEIGDKLLDGYADIYYIFVIPLLLLLLYEFVEYRRRG